MKILIDMNLFPTWRTTFTTAKIESAYLEALSTFRYFAIESKNITDKLDLPETMILDRAIEPESPKRQSPPSISSPVSKSIAPWGYPTEQVVISINNSLYRSFP
jgi:hypothetical protein